MKYLKFPPLLLPYLSRMPINGRWTNPGGSGSIHFTTPRNETHTGDCRSWSEDIGYRFVSLDPTVCRYQGTAAHQ